MFGSKLSNSSLQRPRIKKNYVRKKYFLIRSFTKLRKLKNIPIKKYFGDMFLICFVGFLGLFLEFEGFLKVREGF